MSATRNERFEAKTARDAHDAHARSLGHKLTWEFGLNALRKNHYYFFLGRCGDCGAEVTVGAGGSSCPSVRDARYVECSGPGTAVLTEIEAARCSELIAGAVSDFGRAVANEREATSWEDDVSWTLVVNHDSDGEALSWCHVPDPATNEHSSPVTQVRRNSDGAYVAAWASGAVLGYYRYQSDAIEHARDAVQRLTVSGLAAPVVRLMTRQQIEAELTKRSELARQRIQQGRGCGHHDFEANPLRMHELNAGQDERTEVEVPVDHVYVMPQPGWGAPYGESIAYWTEDGPVWMFRKGQRVRFYDAVGYQRGPEQSNVAPAVAFALSQGWGWAGRTS